MRESRELCLGKVRKLGNDNLVKQCVCTSLLIVLFYELGEPGGAAGAGKESRLPEYKGENENGPGNHRRGDLQLSEEQLDAVRSRLRETLYRRKNIKRCAITCPYIIFH